AGGGTHVIYRLPPAEDPVDQGDIIEGCPHLQPAIVDLDKPEPVAVRYAYSRVVVLTQTCDLANDKTFNVLVAVAVTAQSLVDQQQLKAADIRKAVRALRVYGLYFLPRTETLGLPELIVDLRQLHTVRIEVLTSLCQRGQRRARVQPLYREHL